MCGQIETTKTNVVAAATPVAVQAPTPAPVKVNGDNRDLYGKTGRYTKEVIRTKDEKTRPVAVPGISIGEYIVLLLRWLDIKTGDVYFMQREHIEEYIEGKTDLTEYQAHWLSKSFSPTNTPDVWLWLNIQAAHKAKLEADKAKEMDKKLATFITEVEAIKPSVKVEKPKRKAAKPKKEYTILKGGVARVVHVFVPALTKRFEGEKDNPLCCVRRADNLTRRYLYKKVEFMGAAELSETDPLPGTNGRGICVMKTTGPLKVYH